MMAYMDSGFKKFSSIHDKLAPQLSKYLEKARHKWMTKAKTTLIQKDTIKKNSNNYRRITLFTYGGENPKD